MRLRLPQAFLSIVLICHAATHCSLAEDALTESVEWKLVQRILVAYAKDEGNSVREDQTDVGKELCDRFASIPWVKTIKILPPRDIRTVKKGVIGLRAEERLLHVTFEVGGSKQAGKLTFFYENGRVKFHDVFLDQPFNSYISGRDVIGEKTDVLRKHANTLVSDPSLWQSGNRELVGFRDTSIQLGLQEVSEIAAFSKAAADMIVFGTTWRQQTTLTLEKFFANQDREEKFIKALAELSASVEEKKRRATATTRIEAGASSGSETKTTRREEIQNVITELTSTQAGDFKELFNALNTAHGKLLKYLSSVPEPPAAK